MSEYQVSVVVLTYNPDWEKLKRTLLRILEQENIKFEIIISDDGSETNNFDKIEKLFQEHSFEEYVLIHHKDNLGTVKNFFGAIKCAKGEYIAGSSPGDYFYSSDTLCKFYDFAVSRKADVCYGNFVAYSLGTHLNTYLEWRLPHHSQYFSDGDVMKQKTAFFLAGDLLPGCAIFRSREYALKYIGIVAKHCVYVEDVTSFMYSFADNVPVSYIDEYVVWYEIGFGISTQQNEVWKKRIEKDTHSAIADLVRRYKGDAHVDFFRISNMNINKFKRSCLLTFKHPILRMKKMLLKFGRENVISHKSVDMSKFPKFDEE